MFENRLQYGCNKCYNTYKVRQNHRTYAEKQYMSGFCLWGCV